MAKNKEIPREVEIFKKMQGSPITFVKMMWGLVPQEVKGKYEKKLDRAILDNDWKAPKAHWFKEFVKGEHITWQQALILLAVEKSIQGDKQRISVASGHGIGKSTTLSWLLLWYLYTHKDAQVPCTAPTGDQLFDVLWKEVARWMNQMPTGHKEKFEWQSNYIRVVDYPGSEKIWWARARTARKENPEALAGIHGDWVMFLVDEASGVPEEIYTVGEGALTGENVLVVLISNPTRNTGYFADTHKRDKVNWQTMQFSSIDSPVVEKDYVDRILSKYGEESDEYRIRVLGNFPAEDVMDDKGWVPLIAESKVIRGKDEEFQGEVRLGVDPAGEGDDMTVWVARDNFRAKVVATEKTSNPKTIAQKTLTLIDEFNIKESNITIDNFGVGANVAQELGLTGVRAEAINVGDSPDDEDVFMNIRAEIFWRLREWLINGGELCSDDMKEELKMIRYQRSLRGKKRIISKKDIRKEWTKSPDRADALSLTFYSWLVSTTQGSGNTSIKFLSRNVETPIKNDIISFK